MSGTSVPYSKVSHPEAILSSPLSNNWDECRGTEYGCDPLEEILLYPEH